MKTLNFIHTLWIWSASELNRQVKFNMPLDRLNFDSYRIKHCDQAAYCSAINISQQKNKTGKNHTFFFFFLPLTTSGGNSFGWFSRMIISGFRGRTTINHHHSQCSSKFHSAGYNICISIPVSQNHIPKLRDKYATAAPLWDVVNPGNIMCVRKMFLLLQTYVYCRHGFVTPAVQRARWINARGTPRCAE